MKLIVTVNGNVDKSPFVPSNFDGDFHCEKHDFLSHKSVLYILQITDGYLNETYVVSQLTAAIKMI